MRWQNSFGGHSDEAVTAIKPTADGGFVLAGWSSSSPSGNKTSPYFGISDVWIVRLDAAGNKLWEQTFGGSAQEGVEVALDQTSDGGFLIGTASNSGASGNKTSRNIGFYDFWLIRIDPSGNKLWEQVYGGVNNDYLGEIRQTQDGGFVVAGSSDSSATGNKTSLNHGLLDYWVVRLDPEGNKLWDRSFGGRYDDFLNALDVTPDGGIVLGGETWSDSGGNKTAPRFGDNDFWVVRLDASGNQLWDKAYGADSRDALYDLISLPDGGLLLGGYSFAGTGGNRTSPGYGSYDFWGVRVDVAGNILWDRAFGGSGVDILSAMDATSSGGFVLAGYSSSASDGSKTSADHGNGDYWVVGIDAAGEQVWDHSYGGSASDSAVAIATTADGGYIVGGESLSGASGNKTTAPFGFRDFWLLKLEPDKLEPDSDGDGVPDSRDECPATPTGMVVNASGCSIEQLCPYSDGRSHHGERVACIAHVARSFFESGLISRDELRRIVSEAAHASASARRPQEQ